MDASGLYLSGHPFRQYFEKTRYGGFFYVCYADQINYPHSTRPAQGYFSLAELSEQARCFSPLKQSTAASRWVILP